MTRSEAYRWLNCAAFALGESERYWFGSLYNLACDMAHAIGTQGPEALAKMGRNYGGPDKGPKLRALCLFARALAREVS